ncbi:MAG: outer membrane beta-barrel protein [Flavobacteriales bacterium]
MKKIILSAALIATGIFATAQKNTILVAGEVGYSNTKTDWSGTSTSTSTLTANPKIGYQFSDRMTVGAEWKYTESDSDVATFSHSQKIGGFLRYAVPLSNTFAAYADLGAGYQYTGVGATSGKGFYADLVPALFINVKNGFGLNFNIGGIGYSKLNHTTKGSTVDYDTNDFNFSFGKSIGFGISKNFGAGKVASN